MNARGKWNVNLLLGWLVFTIAVPVAIWVGDFVPTEYANSEKLVQAIVTSVIVIPIVYLLGKKRWGKLIFKEMRIHIRQLKL